MGWICSSFLLRNQILFEIMRNLFTWPACAGFFLLINLILFFNHSKTSSFKLIGITVIDYAPNVSEKRMLHRKMFYYLSQPLIINFLLTLHLIYCCADCYLLKILIMKLILKQIYPQNHSFFPLIKETFG